MSIELSTAWWDDAPTWRRGVVGAALFAAIWGAAALVLPAGAPLGRVVSGAILGSTTALTALGLILIYRANRVVNFSFAAMGAAIGLTVEQLFATSGWPYPVVLVLGVVAGVFTGVVTEVVVIRRFRVSSRLILTVATIGLAQLLGGIELLLPEQIWDPGEREVLLGPFDTPLSKYSVDLGTDDVNGNHFLILAVVPLVLALLAWFLKRTAAGAAIRAAAENSDRARLLGIPVRRIQMLVWGICGGLAGLTFMMRAPIEGTTPTALAGPTVLLSALAASLIARMESMPVAVVASLLLGVIDQVTRWNAIEQTTLPDVVLFIIILGALLLQRRSSSRALDGDGSWQDTAAARPVASQIRRLPEFRSLGVFMVMAMIAVAAILPSWLAPTDLRKVSVAAIWAIVAASLVVLTGWSGQLSLGQFGFVGVGAVTAGNLMVHWNVDLFVSMLAAAITSALAALLIGFPALRIRGPFLAVATLSFAVVLDRYLLSPKIFADLIPGSVTPPVLLQRWPLDEQTNVYWLTLAVLVTVVLLARGVRRARSGRALLATRDNSRAAEAMSVPSRWTALSAFVFSGAIAGLAGALTVLVTPIGEGAFSPVDSVDVFSWSTIGGLSSLGGAMFATSSGHLARASADPAVKFLFSGVILLLVLWLLPGGLAQAGLWVRDQIARVMARRRGIAIAGLAASDDAAPSADAAVPGFLRAESVSVSYGQLQVLFDVDLGADEGEIIALLGTNGAGKSTVLKAMVGLVPSRGRVEVGGVDISRWPTERIVGAGIVLMPGGKSIFPTLTIAEHLRLATWTFRNDDERIRADTEVVLELFPSLRRRLTTRAGDCSGGEQQQLALAQSLLLRPRVLLIDELSLGLSPTLVGQLLDVVRDLNARGTTIVVVEQSVNVALNLAQRAVFMEKGQVRFEGPTLELLDRPDILRSVFIKGAATDSTDSASAGIEIELAALESLTTAGATSGAVLECRGVTKRFGGVIAVDHVDVTVDAGEIVGLIGQNGAGKTTLVDCVSGFHDLDGGTISFRGREISTWAPHEHARARLGRSFQEARLFPSLTVTETLAVACERHTSSRSLVADAFRQPASYESELATSARVEILTELLGLGDHSDKLTSELSTGTRRIVELACLLAEDPVLLLLDEPSAGVAQRETEALGPLLRRVRDVTGVAMLVIEHDMPLLSGICDRLVAMELGAVITTGTPDEVLADERVVASYLGTDVTAKPVGRRSLLIVARRARSRRRR